jgi:N-acetylglucosamine-6-phosphate deacetylase
LGLNTVDAARMASEYPAAFLGASDEHGRIEVGYRADLVATNDGLSVTGVWINGRGLP